ncbi:MAG: SDR family NAD(P)-dependent oxidoreductase [Candidatus Dormibacteraeota bacterium]|uniref:SDR family NAD(P)-dependent oxidoreductase n=1 Tax=Candidatus Amunia macphersoniae TaxID=3127014 RepID=A0A934KJ71_9BACT|nr:SDR family NAD(P)-dependent oxidoreductase [Candidatus Dormibacteraeota bacterium]
MTAVRALVTGGAGFVGSHLVDALLEDGLDVTVLDNLDPQAHEGGVPRFLNGAARHIAGDLRDRDSVATAMEDVQVVFHQGGMVGNGQSMYEMARYIDVNARGTAVLMEEVLRRRDRVRRVVAASSMVVYGDGAYECQNHGVVSALPRAAADLDARRWEPRCPCCRAFVQPAPTAEDFLLRPTSPYAIGKLACEQLVLVTGEAHGIECVALRYLNVYGPRQALGNPYTGVAAVFCTRLLAGRPPLIFEDGEQQRDLVHVDDVVCANLRAMSSPKAVGQAINVGTGTSLTVRALADTLAHALAPQIEPEISQRWRAGDIRHCWADTRRARDLLGFVAQTDRSDALRRLAEWVAGEAPIDRTEAAMAELSARGLIR